MNTVLSLIILLCQNTLKKDINYTIANYILQHVYEINDLSIKAVAEACYTSTSSVMKFINTIGYESYSEFKRQLQSNIVIRKLQLENKCKNLDVDDLLDILKQFSIYEFDCETLKKQIYYVVDQIHAKQEIYLYGATFPLALTQSFQEDFAIMKIPVTISQIPKNKQILDQKNGVHLIITLSGRLIELNRSGYLQICSNECSVLLSCKKDLNATGLITLPETNSSDLDEVVLLMVIDLIKLVYYQEHFIVS